MAAGIEKDVDTEEDSRIVDGCKVLLEPVAAAAMLVSE